MFEILIPLLAVTVSLYLWGIIRTAIWLGLSLLAGEFSILVSASVLSFGAVMFLLAPYRAGAFDFRDFSKQKVSVGFFLTGIATGFLCFPPHLLHYLTGTFISFFLIQVFKLVKFPVNLVIFIPRYSRILILAAWVVALGIRLIEWKLAL